MSFYLKWSLLAFTFGFLVSGCGGSSSKSDEPLPKEINIAVSLPESFSVKEGEIFEIEASARVTPYHPDIKLTYLWDKVTYKKSLSQLMDDYDGSFERAAASGVREAGFATGRKIIETAPDVEPGGYVIYTVTVSAEGYHLDFQTNGLKPLYSLITVTLTK